MVFNHHVQGVADFGQLLQEFLGAAADAKKTTTIEPALNTSDFTQLLQRVEVILPPSTPLGAKKHIIETAVRDTFSNLLATTSIDAPSFVQLWNLLDIVAILSDEEHAEPALLFWLVEELLESQTITGCRKVFDYLDSRRERITAKNFAAKQLTILRSCNELLRRLSRAEDTSFCGRVFLFLFSSFPLGDKSSVNLRGEYHTENVTTFDLPTPPESESESTDQVSDGASKSDAKQRPSSPASLTADRVAKSGSEAKPEQALSADQLYPIFWSLQQSFSQPKKLFEPSAFAAFKSGLEATMITFKSVQSEHAGGRAPKPVDEMRRGLKRKRSQSDEDLSSAFNPKYLTSRDMFELEINDLSFRRHILVQMLIIIDFMLSLSAKSKEKLASASIEKPNTSVLYAEQILSDDDATWCLGMKKSVADYLKGGFDGAFFYRMVETVLSRDKNWARWKIENCPSISRSPVSVKEFSEARVRATKETVNKKLRPHPMGSLNLDFLAESDSQRGLERLRKSASSRLPDLSSFQKKIEMDDLDIEFALTDEQKGELENAKASKIWRALRVASKTKLPVFDKFAEPGFKNIADLFAGPSQEAHDESEETLALKDRTPIVISGPSGVGKGTLVTKLLSAHPAAFGKKASHTTRAPRVGENHGEHYYFVNQAEYDAMRDNGEFLELNRFNGNDYGTSKRVVEAIIDQGKVPVMEMDYHGIQQLKDSGYSARYIFLAPPSMPELESRLTKRGNTDPSVIKERLQIAEAEIAQSHVEGFHDIIIVNDDLETAYKKLEHFIFGNEESMDGWSPVTPAGEPGKASPHFAEADDVDMVTVEDSVSGADAPVNEPEHDKLPVVETS